MKPSCNFNLQIQIFLCAMFAIKVSIIPPMRHIAVKKLKIFCNFYIQTTFSFIEKIQPLMKFIYFLIRLYSNNHLLQTTTRVPMSLYYYINPIFRTLDQHKYMSTFPSIYFHLICIRIKMKLISRYENH